MAHWSPDAVGIHLHSPSTSGSSTQGSAHHSIIDCSQVIATHVALSDDANSCP